VETVWDYIEWEYLGAIVAPVDTNKAENERFALCQNIHSLAAGSKILSSHCLNLPITIQLGVSYFISIVIVKSKFKVKAKDFEPRLGKLIH